jgi:hypothetical protein
MPRPTFEFVPLSVFRTETDVINDVTTITPVNATALGFAKYDRYWTGSTTSGYKSLTARQRKKLYTLAHTVRIQEDGGVPYNYEKAVIQMFGVPGSDSILRQRYTNSVVLSSFSSPGHLEESYVKARARLSSQVNKMAVNLAQMMGERKQTVNLLVSTATRIVQAARAMRHADWRSFANALSLNTNKVSSVVPKSWAQVAKTPIDKRIASHWLEYQYGWKPLIQDAYGVADLFANHVKNDQWHSVAFASATVEQHSVAPANFPSPEVWTARRTSTKMAIKYRMTSETRAILGETGISNPALLAWELLPYSFVVDWFLPVGNYLEAMDAFSGFALEDGYVVQFSKYSCANNFSGGRSYIDGLHRVTESHFGQSWTNRVLLTRYPLYDFPGVGPLTMKNPIGGEPIARLLTAVSLMRVLFKH